MDLKPSLSASTWADDVEAEEAELGGAPIPVPADHSHGYGRSPPSYRTGGHMPAPMPLATVPLPDNPPFKAYVGNIPYDLDELVIERFFDGLKVTDIIITRHRDTGRAKGCFVEFATKDDLAKAVALDGSEMLRRAVKIQIAEPRSGGPPSRGFGGSFDRDRGDRGGRGGRYNDDFGDGFSRGRNSRGGDRGGFGGRSFEPAEPLEPGRERPKLVLQPRTKPIEATDEVKSPSGGAKSNPFGNAHPTDTAAKLRELELRDSMKKKDSDSLDKPAGTDSTPPPSQPPGIDAAKRSAAANEPWGRGAPGRGDRGRGGRGGDGGRGRGPPAYNAILTRGGGDRDDGTLPHHRQGEDSGRGRGGRGGSRGGGRGAATGGTTTRQQQDKEKKAAPKPVVLDEDDKPKVAVSNVYALLGGDDDDGDAEE